jgi:PAS domain S-box-containing protein
MPDSPVSKLLPPESDPIPPVHKRMLDGSYDGVYFVDRERRITYWNRGAEELTGYIASEALGRQCFDRFLQHVNDQKCALCLNGCPLVSAITDGKRRDARMYLRHKLGHFVPVFVRVAPIVNSAGHIVGAGAVLNYAPQE